jgi:spore germination cell wall hydrolase CwlJ-like protein
MVDWQGREQSSNIEDRRGDPPAIVAPRPVFSDFTANTKTPTAAEIEAYTKAHQEWLASPNAPVMPQGDRRRRPDVELVPNDTFESMFPASGGSGGFSFTAQAGLSDAEIEALTYTLLGEAEGEGAEGMIAVANVIRNRANSGLYRTSSPYEIAIQKGQFTTNDPVKGNQPATRLRNPPGSKLYNVARQIALETFVAGTMPDLTAGAISYHSDSVMPYWAPAATTSYGTKKIGDHVFYARIAPELIAPTPLPRPTRFASLGNTGTIAPLIPAAGNDALEAIDKAIQQSQATNVAKLTYANFGARNQPVSDVLEREIQIGVTSVYGAGYRVEIMSGTGAYGTARHRDEEHGYAADVWIYGPDGHRLTAEEMRPMGQHWLANKVGSVGMPQPGDGNSLHLDLIGGKGPAARPLGRKEGIQWTYPPGGKKLPTTAPEYVVAPDAVKSAMTYVGIPRQRPNFDRAGKSSGQMIDELRIETAYQKAPPQSRSGLLEPGNIELDSRPVVANKDGTVSTEQSISFEEDGKEVLIPTIINGKKVSDEEAIEHYHETGEHLGKFSSPEAANAAAEGIHKRQEKRVDTAPVIRITELPPRRPETVKEAPKEAPKVVAPIQTATLPSGKVIEVGRIYTVNGRDYIGSVDAGGVGALKEAPAGFIVDEAGANSIAGEAVREGVRKEVGKGIKLAVAAAPGLAQGALDGVVDLAGDIGGMFGGLFGGGEAKPTGGERIDNLILSYTSGSALGVKKSASGTINVINKAPDVPASRPAPNPQGSIQQTRDAYRYIRNPLNPAPEGVEADGTVDGQAGAKGEAEVTLTPSRARAEATVSSPTRVPAAAVSLTPSKVKATATVASPKIVPAAVTEVQYKAPPKKAPVLAPVRATKSVEQIGREADNARLNGYRAIQEMGPRTPTVKPPVLKPVVTKPNVPTQAQLQAMRDVTGVATKSPVKAVGVVTGNLGASMNASTTLTVSKVKAKGGGTGMGAPVAKLGGDVKVKTLSIEGSKAAGSSGTMMTYAGEISLPAKKIVPVKVVPARRPATVVPVAAIPVRRPEMRKGAPVDTSKMRFDAATGQFVAIPAAANSNAPQLATEWQQDRFQWTENTYVPVAISGSTRWQTGY